MNNVNPAGPGFQATRVSAAPEQPVANAWAVRVAPDPVIPAVTKAALQPVAAQKAPDAAALKQAVSELQQKTRLTSPNLQFSIDNDTGRTVIKVTDAETKELIRQIPPEEVIRLNKELDKMQGLLLNRQA